MNWQKFKALHESLAVELAKSPEQRDQAGTARLLKDITAEIGEAEKGYAAADELTKAVAQLRGELDAQQKTLVELRRSGLALKDGGIVLPRGRGERLEMLRDKRAFISDESAKRFGGYMVGRAFAIYGKESSCPQAVREVGQSVLKDFEASSKDMAPGTGSAGGYLIPDEFRAEIIRNVEALGNVFTRARRMPLMTIGSTKIPVRTAGVSAYWTAPASQPNTSTPGFNIVTLQPEKLMALVAIPNEFFRTQMLIDLGQFIGTEIVYAMAYTLDDAIVNGDGSASYGGITGILQSATIASVSAASTHTTVATLTGTDISNVIGDFPVQYALGEATWLMSLSVKGALRALKSTTGVPLYLRGGNGEPNTIDDYPYIISPRMPVRTSISNANKYAAFGDLRRSHMVGMLRELEIASSDQAGFLTDQTYVRGIMHVDIQEIDADAMVTAKTAA
jgi:HK97 family phage major capsid protein